MAERYGNSEISSAKDISEIKSTLNNLATRLERTQLRAVTPERRTVQFTPTTPTKSYSQNTSPTAPIRNFDPITGQRLDIAPKYDLVTGARLYDSASYKQRQDSVKDKQVQRNRSPSPAY